MSGEEWATELRAVLNELEERMLSKAIFSATAIAVATGCAMPIPPAEAVEATFEIPATPRDEVWTGRIAGRLGMLGNCLTVHSDQTGEDYLLVWSNGTRFDGQRVAVVAPGGREKVISIGQHVRLDGSHRSWDDIDHLTELHRFREACDFPLFFVVQAL